MVKLLSAIIVNVGKKNSKDTGNMMLNVLSILIDEKMDASEKLKFLKNYDVSVTNEIEMEVEKMTSYTAHIIEVGLEKGRAQAIFQCVNDGDFSIQRGAEKLGMSEDEFDAEMKKAGYKVTELV